MFQRKLLNMESLHISTNYQIQPFTGQDRYTTIVIEAILSYQMAYVMWLLVISVRTFDSTKILYQVPEEHFFNINFRPTYKDCIYLSLPFFALN